jgi:hypothetical protein
MGPLRMATESRDDMNDGAWFERIVAEEAEKRRRALMEETRAARWAVALALVLIFVLAGCATTPSKIGAEYDLFLQACNCQEGM